MPPQAALLLEDFGADVTLEGLNADIVNVSHVLDQDTLAIKAFRAKATLKRLDVTNTVNCSHVQTHAACLRKLLAANLTRVLGVRMLWSWRPRRFHVTFSVRCVVVSADR